MSNELPPKVTGLLLAWSDGHIDALAELMPLVCDELRFMARRSLGGENKGHTLQPTALVHEFFLRIQARRSVDWKNRKHFFGWAAEQMRQILVDHARRQGRKKRGSGETPIALGDQLDQLPMPASFSSGIDSAQILDVHNALERLEAADSRAAEIVKQRFFVGMTVKETAAALGVSEATVKRNWKFARLWLFRDLQSRQD